MVQFCQVEQYNLMLLEHEHKTLGGWESNERNHLENQSVNF